MKQVILVAHGKLASAMKESAKMIFGKLPDISTVEFLENEGLETFKEKIRLRLNPQADGILIFADLFCGTPYNASCALAMENPRKEIEILSGLSLPLLLELSAILTQEDQKLKEIIKYLKEVAKGTVQSFDKEQIKTEEDF